MHHRFFEPANAGDGPKRDKSLMILMAANCRPFHGLVIRLILILGLAPQALCSRLLRRLQNKPPASQAKTALLVQSREKFQCDW